MPLAWSVVLVSWRGVVGAVDPIQVAADLGHADPVANHPNL